MSIAATANSNYTAALFIGAGTPSSAPSGGRAAIIAEIVARILQPNADSTNSPSPASSGAAIILTQLLSSTRSVGSTNGTVPMELNLNQLLNNTVLQKALLQLPPELLARPQVIEALVLQNTLLPAATGKEQQALPLLILPTPTANTAAAQNTGTLYRINIEWQNRLIQLLSPQPLPTGTRVPLQIDARGAITLLPPEVAAKILLAQNNIVRPVSQQPVQPSLTLSPAPMTPTQTIQQALRELLPRQQALHSLVPLLQKFIAPSVREQLPPSVFKALAQLLQSLPKPAQLHTAENVKQAINNSGSFLEAKLTQTATATPGAEPLPKIAATDLKAQISTLISLIRQFAPPATAKPTTATATANPTATAAATLNPTAVVAPGSTTTAAIAPDAAETLLATLNSAAAPATVPKTAATPSLAPFVTETVVADEDFVYTKPTVQNSPGTNAPAHDSEPLDVLLAQLSKLLQAGFARIQLNQLDSASARHISHDAQAPVPTWVLELPLRTPHGVDQLQLRIEQRRKQQQQQTQVQWNVEIAFDLHAAGKLAASLAIIGKSVSATLWAERAHTHQCIREDMAYLRAGLESVGVKVTEMQCRLGLPTPRSQPISQQLVDVHT